MSIRKTALAAILSSVALPALYLASAPAAAQPVHEAAAIGYVESARALYQSGQYEKASAEIKSALKAHPNDGAARLLLGQMLLGEGDITGALKELGRAHTLAPSDETAVLLAEARLQAGDAEGAISLVRGPSATPDGTVRRLTITGVASSFLGDYDAAEVAYEKIIEMDPRRVEGHFGLAHVYNERKNYRAAAEKLEQITQGKPDFAPAWSLRGEVAMERGFLDEAFASFDQAIALTPDSTLPLIARARAFLSAGRLEEARADAERVEKLAENSPIAHYLHSAVAYAEGEIDKANRAFTHLQRSFDNFSPAVLLGALIKQRKGELNQAGALFRRYIEMKPNSIEARRALAAVRLASDQPRNALDMLDVVLSERPDDVESLHRRASALVGTSRYREATALYTRLLNKGSPQQRRHAEEALTLLAPSPGASNDPVTQYPAARHLLVKAIDRLYEGDAAQARALLGAVNVDDSALLFSLRGRSEAGLGNLREARQSLEHAIFLDPERLDAVRALTQLDRREGRAAETLPRMQALLQKRPDNEPLIVEIASFLESGGNTDEMVAFLTEQRTAMPNATSLSRPLIAGLSQQGNTVEAAAEATRFALLEPTNPDTLLYAARVLVTAGVPDRAVEVLRRLQAVSPNDPEIVMELAETQGFAGDIDAARQTLRNAAARWPDNRDIAAAQVGLEMATERPDAVTALIEQRRASDPAAAARLSLIAGTGDPAEAHNVLQQVFAENPSSEAAIDVFEARQRIGLHEEALDEMTRWLESNPNDVDALREFAAALLSYGRLDRAEIAYEQVIILDANDVTALNNYAWLRHIGGRNDALEFARRAYYLSDDSPDIADTYGWLLVNYGRLKEGLEVLRRANAGAPDNPEIAFHLASALSKAGLRDDARALMVSTLEGQPKFAAREDVSALMQTLDAASEG